MLTKLILENWKSYEKAELFIDQLSVLVGTNASGKSNALDALLLLQRLAQGSMIMAALQGDSTQQAVRGGIEWAARRPETAFTVGAVCRADDFTDYEYRVKIEARGGRCDLVSEQLVRVKYRANKSGERGSKSGEIKLFRTDTCSPADPTITARLYNEKQGTPRPLSRAHSVLSQIFGQKLRQEIQDGVANVLGTLKDIFILDPIPSHMRNYTALSDQLEPDANNIAGVLAALPEKQRNRIESVLTRYGSRLPERDIKRIYTEKVGKFGSDAMLYCEELWGAKGQVSTVDARGMSDGTLRFLAIMTALLTRPSGSLLVIEEVDNGLHPSRSALLLDMLKDIGISRNVDVLVTTHNPALLDAMGNEMVPFITVVNRDLNKGFSTLTLLEEMEDLPKLLSYGSIGRISSKGLLEKKKN
ncbi:AAA family ATPase [Comamonas testosteroni]|uniref:AAA family ATPase n=1 Tax=Comamonas testosteroni TaxID=285 RepID=UPI0005B46EAB|nr:ATP-binding protein [Comamonas testosteroni]